MKTFRITENEIKDMKPVAVGYKIFRNDWTAKSSGYDYKDENGNVLNTIHKVDGDIKECNWGLHFSKEPIDCFKFYETIPWYKFAKVEAYDQLLIGEEKCVTNILKIIEIYTFDEFINLIREDLQHHASYGVYGSNGVSSSRGVNASDGVYSSDSVIYSGGVSYSKGASDSFGVSETIGVNCSKGVTVSNGVNGSNGVNLSKGVNRSNGVNWSKGVNVSYGVNRSNGVNSSYGVNVSNGVNWSNGVSESKGVDSSYGVDWSYGVSESKGVNRSYGILECEGISRAIFCYKKSGKLMAFNKRITEERFDEICAKLNKFNWYPKFNNAEQLKGELEWYKTNIPAIESVDNKTAWSSMPEEMLKYIKSLPEYDEKIFNKITGGEL